MIRVVADRQLAHAFAASVTKGARFPAPPTERWWHQHGDGGPVWHRPDLAAAVRAGTTVTTYSSTTAPAGRRSATDTISLGTSAYVGIAVYGVSTTTRSTARVSIVPSDCPAGSAGLAVRSAERRHRRAGDRRHRHLYGRDLHDQGRRRRHLGRRRSVPLRLSAGDRQRRNHRARGVDHSRTRLVEGRRDDPRVADGGVASRDDVRRVAARATRSSVGTRPATTASAPRAAAARRPDGCGWCAPATCSRRIARRTASTWTKIGSDTIRWARRSTSASRSRATTRVGDDRCRRQPARHLRRADGQSAAGGLADGACRWHARSRRRRR